MDGEIFLKLVSFGDELTITKNNHVDLLAKQLGMSVVNNGLEDTSNQRIFSDVVKFICENNTSEYFFLVGWTSQQRQDIYWKDEYFTYRPDKRVYNDNSINGMHRGDEVLFNPILTSGQWSTMALSLQETFEFHDCKYFMYNTQDCIQISDHNAKNIKSLKTTNYHNPLNKSSSMKYYLEQQSLQSHTWADFLYRKINAGGVL